MRTPRLLALASLLAAQSAHGADCNANGVADIEEVRSGALPDCNGNGVPDACDILPVNYGLVSAGSFFAGQSAAEILVEDFDGDGDVDLATSSNEGKEQVSFLWNDGSGRFTEPESWPVGQGSEFLVAPDLDMDGLKDLVVGGHVGITVLFQIRERAFLSRAPVLPLNPPPRGLVGGDLDSDFDVDLAALEPFGARVLRNERGGFFSPLEALPIGSTPVEIVAATLDGDEHLDLATCNSTDGAAAPGNVSIFINRGDGSFETARNYGTSRDPLALVSGDLDGDGDKDLATAGQYTITLLFGDDQGRFTESKTLMSEKQLFELASGDLDGDGQFDLAAGGARVSVFLSQGATEFRNPVGFELGAYPSDLKLSDIHGDGFVDLLVGNSETVTVLQRFDIPYSTDCNSNLLADECELVGNDCNENRLPDACDVASRESDDCDRNSKPDECQPDCNGNKVADECDIASGFAADCNRNALPDDCDIGDEDLAFETGIVPVTSFTGLFTSSDLDGDGNDDVLADSGLEALILVWNNEHQGLLTDVRLSQGTLVSDIAAGDLDGDADKEIVLAAGALGIRVLENRGNRTFGPAQSIPVEGGARGVSVADLDGDLDLEFVAVSSDGWLWVLQNRGGGDFADPILVTGGVSGRILEVADLDGDGRPDVAVESAQQGSMFVFWNGGSLAFEGLTEIKPSFFIQATAITDVDGDGDLDVLFLTHSLMTDQLVLLRNASARSFSVEDVTSRPVFAVGGILPCDLDQDGDQDLAVTSRGPPMAARLNRGNGIFEPPVEILPWVFPVEPPAGGDWNGDGAMDLAVPTDGPPRIIFLTNVSKPPVSRDADLNGVPDECQQRPFHRGDSNGDGLVNLTDPVVTLGHLFRGERAPACLEAADTNNDARLEITDPIATLEFLFRGGAPPAAPGPPTEPCGLDTDAQGSAGDLGCGAYEGCGA